MPNLPSGALIQQIVSSENDYMYDRMLAIQRRPGNPEGVELRRFGNALCIYSRTMPWPSFNTVKGLTAADVEFIDPILEFYQSRGRAPQFELVPSLVDQNILARLAERGFFQSGFHTSLYLSELQTPHIDEMDGITVKELQEDEFMTYAMIHCRGTGLSDDGIPYVAENNKALYGRPGWNFYLAYVKEEPAAAGAMYIKDGIASFTFAASLPQFRNRGLQQRLLHRRIAEASRQGCKLAVGQCAFLSQSHRNMERAGMKIGYVRTNWIAR